MTDELPDEPPVFTRLYGWHGLHPPTSDDPDHEYLEVDTAACLSDLGDRFTNPERVAEMVYETALRDIDRLEQKDLPYSIWVIRVIDVPRDDREHPAHLGSPTAD